MSARSHPEMPATRWTSGSWQKSWTANRSSRWTMLMRRSEPHLATDNELVHNILLALLASLAKVEAQKISERTRAGMARAKAQGTRIGRPSIAPNLRQQIA